MPRTFTLGQLLMVVTLACVACWFVVTFPTTAIKAGLTLTYFIPGLALGGLLSLASSRRRRAIAMCGIGAVGGIAATPQSLRIWGDYNLGWWDLYPMFFLEVAAYTTIGAILGSVTAVICFPRWWKKELRTP
jgi:hypothetical protein